MAEHKVKKLPLVDDDGRLLGLMTSRDIRPAAAAAVCDARRAGAAARRRRHRRPRRLPGARRGAVRAGVDVLVIDIAHGHSAVMERALGEVRKRFPEAEVIAGNVATADGARFLAERGASAVKVGIGPGGGCTTRMTTSFGVPQLQAIVECRRALPETHCPDCRWRHQAPRRVRAGARSAAATR